MNYFGVCVCDLNERDPKIKRLVRCNSYHDAVKEYLNMLGDEISGLIPENLFVCFISEDGKTIIQLERLSWQVKCKMLSAKEE